LELDRGRDVDGAEDEADDELLLRLGCLLSLDDDEWGRLLPPLRLLLVLLPWSGPRRFSVMLPSDSCASSAPAWSVVESSSSSKMYSVTSWLAMLRTCTSSW
jgi:hypothetical protein